MGSILIEIFDVKVLNGIYPKVYISREYGMSILCILSSLEIYKNKTAEVNIDNLY